MKLSFRAVQMVNFRIVNNVIGKKKTFLLVTTHKLSVLRTSFLMSCVTHFIFSFLEIFAASGNRTLGPRRRSQGLSNCAESGVNFFTSNFD